MKTSGYYELRCAVVEMFYEVLQADKSAVGQAAGRCLVEFRGEARSGGREALVVLSVLLARVARHDPSALKRFEPEVGALRALSRKSSSWGNLTSSEKERMQEDVRYVLEKAAT